MRKFRMELVCAALLASVFFLWSCAEDESENVTNSNEANSSGQNRNNAMGGDAANSGADGNDNSTEQANTPADGNDGTNTALTPRQRLLLDLRKNVFEPTYAEFAIEAAALNTAIETWAASLNDETLDAAKAAWSSAMSAWQIAEVMQVGPSGTSGRRLGGMDYRDRIYSFPLSNSCRVDGELVKGNFEDEGWVEDAQFNIRGLDAIEYLLFGSTDSNTCPTSSAINRNGTWSAEFGSDVTVLSTRRATYAKTLSAAVLVDANYLKEAWRNEEGSFGQKFINADAPFETEKNALDQVFAGIFYVDKFIKDLKLGKPAGITPDCTADAGLCPDSVESKWSGRSKANLLANLEGFRRVYLGGDADDSYGFYDLLVEEGASDLADRMLANLNNADDAVESIETSIENQLNLDNTVVEAAHAAVRAITDDLKSQFVTVLNLSVPQEGAGDND